MTFVCSISGIVPEEPVVSKTGFIFEKRLIEEYILCNNSCPITKSELKLEDLIEIKLSSNIKPRLINNTNIPEILNTLKTEWDAIMLELFELRRELEQTKMQLTHSLYQHDASCRVIARITRERDDAINRLKEIENEILNNNDSNYNKIDINKSNINRLYDNNLDFNKNKKYRNNDYINISKEIQDLFLEYSEKMKPIRKKLNYPDLLSKEDIMSFELKKKAYIDLENKLQVGILTNNNIICGFVNGNILIFDSNKFDHNNFKLKIDSLNYGKINNISVIDIDENLDLPKCILASYENSRDIHIFSNNNNNKEYDKSIIKFESYIDSYTEINSIEIHPLKKHFVINSSNSKLFSLFDLEYKKQLSCYYLKDNNSYSDLKIHPDGLIISGITFKGEKIDIWDIRSLEKVCTLDYEHEGLIKGRNSICFSNNGYYLFTTSSDSKINLWDLRKSTILNYIDLNDEKLNKDFDLRLSIDESGKYISFWNKDKFSIFSLLEKNKIEKLINFSEESDDFIQDIYFGKNANSIYTFNHNSVVKFWSKG